MPPGERKTAATLLVILAMATGCGHEGPQRYDVSGEVTFKGKPVPFGMIRFFPGIKLGNRGPAGYAAIKEGRYSTAETGRGTVGGPHEVVITGSDGKADPSGEQMHGAPLFPDYRTTADLPKDGATMDFDVPAPPRGRRF